MKTSRNKVSDGDYKGKPFILSADGRTVTLKIGLFKHLEIDKTTIRSYQILDNDKLKLDDGNTISDSFKSPGYWLIGASFSKRQATDFLLSSNLYYIGIEFMDGKRSIAEMDDITYTAFFRALY